MGGPEARREQRLVLHGQNVPQAHRLTRGDRGAGDSHARSGTVEIAYQTVGDGDLTLFYLPRAHVPIDLIWEEPPAEIREDYEREIDEGERLNSGLGHHNDAVLGARTNAPDPPDSGAARYRAVLAHRIALGATGAMCDATLGEIGVKVWHYRAPAGFYRSARLLCRHREKSAVTTISSPTAIVK